MKPIFYVKNERLSMPVISTLVTYMALDYYHAPEWLWGVMAVLFAIRWILFIAWFIMATGVDIFDETGIKKVKSSFQERLEQISKQRKS